MAKKEDYFYKNQQLDCWQENLKNYVHENLESKKIHDEAEARRKCKSKFR